MLLNDPFGRSRLPADLDRRRRVELYGRAAEDLVAGRLPTLEARLFLGGGILARLENGGNLERDFLKLLKPKSHETPSVLWRQIKESAHFDEDERQ